MATLLQRALFQHRASQLRSRISVLGCRRLAGATLGRSLLSGAAPSLLPPGNVHANAQAPAAAALGRRPRSQRLAAQVNRAYWL